MIISCFISCYGYDKHNMDLAVCKHESKHESQHIGAKPTQKKLLHCLESEMIKVLITKIFFKILNYRSLWFSMICWHHKVSNLYTYTITVADVYFSTKYKEKKMFQLFNVLDHASETTVHYYVLLHRYVHYVLCNQSHCIEVAQEHW